MVIQLKSVNVKYIPEPAVIPVSGCTGINMYSSSDSPLAGRSRACDTAVMLPFSCQYLPIPIKSEQRRYAKMNLCAVSAKTETFTGSNLGLRG
jgi:hypothetical protein